MYAMAHMIYGYPLVTNDQEPSPRARLPRVDDALDEEMAGFLTYYSGAADETPAAFGIRLGRFDEACAFVPIAEIPLAPTEDQRTEFQRLLEALPSDLQGDLRGLGEPSVFLLWATS